MPGRLQDLRFLHGSHQPRCAAVMDKRFAGYRTLQFMAAGSVELAYGQRIHRLAGTWVWPHHPGPRIRLRATGAGTWDHRYIAVAGPLAEAWADEGLWPLSPQRVEAADGIGGRIDACLELFRDGGRLRHRRAVNQFEDILLLLAERRGAGRREAWVERACHLLADPLAGFHPEVPAVAAACRMPPSTFRRRFAAATGMSPQAWALHARMGRARGCLRFPGAPGCPHAVQYSRSFQAPL
ncbi:MAG: hypothetical protein J0M02_19640, partial [Planctomycetes bacterium]|nr:hypothetical protein [Planctomycetota bacterium]